MMKLQVGVGSLKELEYYIDRGAAELYCGLYRVPSHVKGARNLGTAAEVGEAVALAHSAGRKLYFVANEVHAELLDSGTGRKKFALEGLRIITAYQRARTTALEKQG